MKTGQVEVRSRFFCQNCITRRARELVQAAVALAGEAKQTRREADRKGKMSASHGLIVAAAVLSCVSAAAPLGIVPTFPSPVQLTGIHDINLHINIPSLPPLERNAAAV